MQIISFQQQLRYFEDFHYKRPCTWIFFYFAYHNEQEYILKAEFALSIETWWAQRMCMRSWAHSFSSNILLLSP